MTITFSEKPGAFERHEQRKHNNLLFFDSSPVTIESVTQAQQKDEQAHEAFMGKFQQLINEIVSLDQHVEGQTVTDLKTRLDACFQASSTLPGDLSDIHTAIQKLMTPIMLALQSGLVNDPIALGMHEEENAAKAIHHALLEIPLAADLMMDASPIIAEELTATLLTESPETLPIIMQIFSNDQCSALLNEATKIVQHIHKTGSSTGLAEQQLKIIKTSIQNNNHEAT